MPGVYPIPRDATESERLKVQHEYLVKLSGFLIHPTIKLSPTASSLYVADIAAGTGIFLSDVAKQVPAASQLHAFDISDAQFPALDKKPANIDFHVHDVREPFSDDLIGKFDLVCIRLVVVGLLGDDWDKAVANVVSLLKPGGYVQWIEADHSQCQIFHRKAGAPASAAKEVVNFINGWFKGWLPGPLCLPGLLGENGLELLADERWATDGLQHEKGWSTYFAPMFIMSAGKAAVDAKVKTGELEREVADNLLQRAVAEASKGEIYQHSEMIVYVGRKPL